MAREFTTARQLLDVSTPAASRKPIRDFER
jgi:hypothetical protein